MRFFISAILIFISTTYLSAQSNIEISKKGLGTTFKQNGIVVTPKRLMEITSGNKEAQHKMRLAKPNYDVAQVFGLAGGFCIGWPLGAAIAGGEPNWAILGIGVGLVAVSIPFTLKYNSHAKDAIQIYNAGLAPSSATKKVEFQFGLASTGVGLKMTF